MHRQVKAWLVLNVLGGSAVLGSYAYGILTHPSPGATLWGTVPDALKPLYSVCMFSAAAGYFFFSYYFVIRVGPGELQIGGRDRFGLLMMLYGLVLIPSALWMPLTFAVVEHPTVARWWLMRLDLFLVGVGSLGLLGVLFALPHRPRGVAGWLALAGLVCFCLQTAFLDAWVWPALVGIVVG